MSFVGFEYLVMVGLARKHDLTRVVGHTPLKRGPCQDLPTAVVLVNVETLVCLWDQRSELSRHCLHNFPPVVLMADGESLELCKMRGCCKHSLAANNRYSVLALL